MPLVISLLCFIGLILAVRFGIHLGRGEGYGEAYMDWLHYGKFQDLMKLRPRNPKHRYPPLSSVPSAKYLRCDISLCLGNKNSRCMYPSVLSGEDTRCPYYYFNAEWTKTFGEMKV